MAKDAGYIEFDGLPGKIKTGCHASPQYKGRYCICHTPNACALDVTIDEEDALQLNGAVGPLVRHTKQPLSNPVAELIVDKKVTHPSVFVSVTGQRRCVIIKYSLF